MEGEGELVALVDNVRSATALLPATVCCSSPCLLYHVTLIFLLAVTYSYGWHAMRCHAARC